VDAFAANVDEHLVVLDAILALMDEVAPYTIEAVVGRSDLELGLEALLGHRRAAASGSTPGGRARVGRRSPGAWAPG